MDAPDYYVFEFYGGIGSGSNYMSIVGIFGTMEETFKHIYSTLKRNTIIDVFWTYFGSMDFLLSEYEGGQLVQTIHITEFVTIKIKNAPIRTGMKTVFITYYDGGMAIRTRRGELVSIKMDGFAQGKHDSDSELDDDEWTDWASLPNLHKNYSILIDYGRIERLISPNSNPLPPGSKNIRFFNFDKEANKLYDYGITDNSS
uniref:Uncharacterized protein n=1 Tax=Marseillevirus LCMAC101 TaxID=2506602 RepID=A0A481YQL3_9VIRU|nr:MAG: hypothetical protein LCMAC101_00550 [Marseillevirus LCMAC101]